MWIGRLQWGERGVLYRYNPILSRTFIRNMDSEASYRPSSPAVGRAFFLTMGLDAPFWAAAAGRQRNTYRRAVCLEMAAALEGAKTYAELKAERDDQD